MNSSFTPSCSESSVQISYTGLDSKRGSMAAVSHSTKPVQPPPPAVMSSSSKGVVPGRMMSEARAVGVRYGSTVTTMRRPESSSSGRL